MPTRSRSLRQAGRLTSSFFWLANRIGRDCELFLENQDLRYTNTTLTHLLLIIYIDTLCYCCCCCFCLIAVVGRETAVPGDDSSMAPLLGPVPLVAVPIITGVGSEVTPMATILDDHDPLEPEKVRMYHGIVRACA